MKIKLLLTFLLSLCTVSLFGSADADRASIEPGDLYASPKLSMQAWTTPAPIDSSELDVLTQEVNTFAQKSLRQYIISAIVGLGAALIIVIGALTVSFPLLFLGILVALVSSGIGIASFVNLLKGRGRLSRLDAILARMNKPKLTALYEEKVASSRTVLKILLILTIVSLALSFLSSVFSSAA